MEVRDLTGDSVGLGKERGSTGLSTGLAAGLSVSPASDSMDSILACAKKEY